MVFSTIRNIVSQIFEFLAFCVFAEVSLDRMPLLHWGELAQDHLTRSGANNPKKTTRCGTGDKHVLLASRVHRGSFLGAGGNRQFTSIFFVAQELPTTVTTQQG